MNDFVNPAISGLPRQIKRIKTSGLLYIGDPHMTCARPGRRVEEDFLPVVLDKLTQSFKIAAEGDLYPLILGDLFNNATSKLANTQKHVEDTNRMISGFARASQLRPCATIPGNHDKVEVRLTEGCTLAALRDLGVIDVIEPGGPYAIFEIDGMTVGVGGTPYGEEIPRDVRGVFGEPVDRVIWLTHSQFEFDIKNPFVDKIFEIVGCDMVVNGHDHTTMMPKRVGQTHWFNPGNLTRMSVDCADHKPSAWEWKPSFEPGQLLRHELVYNKAAFNLVGLQVQPDAKAAEASVVQRNASLFSELLTADQNSDLDRTSSGEMLGEDIERILQNVALSEAAREVVRGLHRRAPERLKA